MSNGAAAFASLELLLVESDAKTRDLFAFFLRAKGHRVREARDSVEAVTVAVKRRADIILLSSKLTTLNGGAALRQLLEAFPATPIVLITDYRAPSSASPTVPAVPQDAGDRLETPFTFTELSTVVDRIAAQCRAGSNGVPSAPAL